MGQAGRKLWREQQRSKTVSGDAYEQALSRAQAVGRDERGPTPPVIEPNAPNPATQERSDRSSIPHPAPTFFCAGCAADCYCCPFESREAL
jgi:hypothetical protein